ncbi:MAG: exo-beta-N-acetylmuramidase NamZ domain-containing protein [Terriglobia bacterium]
MIQRRWFVSGVLTASLWAGPCLAAAVGRPEVAAPSPALSEQRLAGIASVVEQAIREGKCPGAVVLIGHQGKVVYRRAFGERSLVPERRPMTLNTIFDMASLTKVIATTTAVMQLVEQGKILLSAPVADYWPEFKENGKELITVRELMTHYSGLRPDLDLKPDWSGYDTALEAIVAEKPILPPGTRFIYSDINFETLGELVRRVSGEPLDVYCREHIFKPLGMKDTSFKPPASLRERIAPTQFQHGESGPMLWGEVHDPTAYNMGGVAGHAGLFSTADDLAIFAEMLLAGGTYNGVSILSPLTVEKMTTPQTPPNKMVLRGLGWDIESPFASNRGELYDVGSFGHTGFTGTSLWIDPVTKTYVIILTNRVHPDGKGDVVPLRTQVATLVAGALGPASAEQVLASRRSLTGYFELMKGYRLQGLRNGKVKTGIDVLEGENFAPLEGKRVGLIANHTGLASDGRRSIDVLYRAPGVRLVALFSPEHGLAGSAAEGAPVDSTRDAATGLPVYSLFGDVERPTDAMLEGIDALVFDIQDVGARFYTYITTLGYTLEAASKKGMEFYVLDRPNPIDGVDVQGPLLDLDLRSFIGYFPMPVRHGMTVGELAEMYNHENHLDAKLHVVKMRDWQRTDWFDETGQAWIPPSPNLRNLTEEILYPGVCLVEGANVSLGRGTDSPFEMVGAPWINGKELAAYLNGREVQGVRFLPMDFRPLTSNFAGELCHGVQIVLLDRQALEPTEMGVELVAALWKLFPKEFNLDGSRRLIGSTKVLESIRAGRDPQRIWYDWQDALEKFKKLRAQYLLYP